MHELLEAIHDFKNIKSCITKFGRRVCLINTDLIEAFENKRKKNITNAFQFLLLTFFFEDKFSN